MHTLTLDDGLVLRYRLDGRADAPALLFANSLGTDLGMWDAQAATLGDAFRLVRYDTRGHGGSAVPDEPATLERLGRDLLALLDHLGLPWAHLCGLSLGGVTAQWLALHHPARVGRLVLSNTAARVGSVASWDARIAAVKAGGMDAIADAVLARFFSPAFRAAQPATVAAFRATLRATDPAGYVACCAALRDADLRPLVGGILAPTLVVGGTLDEATPPAQAEELHAAIRGSELRVLDGVAHLANVEASELFTALLRRFLLAEKGE
jgi:3-oxoadipate enol-lactonase